MTIQTIEQWLCEPSHQLSKDIRYLQFRDAQKHGDFEYILFFSAPDDEYTKIVRTEMYLELVKMFGDRFNIIGNSQGFHIMFEDFDDAVEFFLIHGSGK